jgi:TfoX/Sxy family transcriptional regulator of competence genes
MDQSTITPGERYAMLVEEFAGAPDVTLPGLGRGFGSSELKVQNKIFAMLSQGRLVVKLPKARVDELVAAGEGERFDPRRDGRVMKEWVCVEPTFRGKWLELAREAMEFVAAKR